MIMELQGTSLCESGFQGNHSLSNFNYTYPNPYVYPYKNTYWQSYPVYIYTDKTAKAISIVKALEEEGFEITDVKKFIALVEKISALL